MRWSAGRFVWALMGLWLVACGGVSQEDFPAALSEAVCRWEARCGVIRDEGACIRNSRESHERALKATGFAYPYDLPMGGSLRAGRMRFDEARAAQCVTRMRALSCESGEDENSVLEACEPYVGQREAGQACLITPECVPGFYCERAGTLEDVCSAGTCVPYAGPGEQPREGQPCARGLTLDAEGRCQSFPGEGGACSMLRGCAEDLYCDSRTLTCRARGREGKACVPGEAPCLFHLNCGDDRVCHRLSNVGEACTPSRSPSPVPRDAPVLGKLRCKEDLTCVGPANEPRGTCRERYAAGEPCTQSWDCQFSLSCAKDASGIHGTCQARVGIGASCGSAECVQGAWCDKSTGTCAPQGKTLGDTCDSSSLESVRSSCVLGFRCEEGRCAPTYGGACEG